MVERELTPTDIRRIKTHQNEMAIEGYVISWDECVEAYWNARNKIKLEREPERPAKLRVL